jgi:hypothetical protein
MGAAETAARDRKIWRPGVGVELQSESISLVFQWRCNSHPRSTEQIGTIPQTLSGRARGLFPVVPDIVGPSEAAASR